MVLAKLPNNGRIGVIGAGISGLSFAFFLNKLRPDVHITIFERSSQPGGWIKTVNLKNSQQDIILEKGPRTLRGISDGTLLIIDILKQLGIENELQVMKKTSSANRRYIVGPDNQLVEIPHSLLTFVKFMTSGVTSGIPLGAIREIFQRKESDQGDESIESFIKRRFKSKALTDNIMSAVIHGVYAGDVSKLSVNKVVPGLVQLEHEHGSIIKGALSNMYNSLKLQKPEKEFSTAIKAYESRISPNAHLTDLSSKLKGIPIVKLKSGLQKLPLTLAEYLQEQKNVDILYDTAVDSVDLKQKSVTFNQSTSQFDHIRSTISSKALSPMIENLRLQQELANVEYVSVFMANIYSRGPLLPSSQHGFGFLVPKSVQNDERLLGIIFDSDIEQFSHSLGSEESRLTDDYSKITLMMGGHFFTSDLPSNSVNLRAVTKCLHQYLGVDLLQKNVILRNEDEEMNKSVELNPNDILISYNLHVDCIPQYNVGYQAVKDQTRKLLAEYNGTVSFGGTSFGKGVGVPDCVTSALEDALEVS